MKNTRPLLASMTCTFVTQYIYLSDLDEVHLSSAVFMAPPRSNVKKLDGLDPLIADPANETPPLHTHPVPAGASKLFQMILLSDTKTF